MTDRTTSGFTLLEVMMAVAILALSLTAIFSSEAGAIKVATRARTTTVATMLARCKMGEIEEKIAKEGMPGVSAEGADKCCEEAEVDGYTCQWVVERVVLPGNNVDNNALDKATQGTKNGLADNLKGAAKNAAPGQTPDPTTALTGAGGGADMLAGVSMQGMLSGGGGQNDMIAQMAMQYAYPIIKPVIEEQVRRATVKITWKEGSRSHSFDVVQYIVGELPPRSAMGLPGAVPGTTDPQQTTTTPPNTTQTPSISPTTGTVR